MDNELFLAHLRNLALEDGRAYLQARTAALTDYTGLSVLLAEEALRLLYTPVASLKLAELLIFLGKYVEYSPSHALGLKAKGDALMQLGHHQTALACLDAAGEEFLCLGDEGNWARSRISWIISAAKMGRVEEALQAAALASDMFLQRGEYDWASAIGFNTALVYSYAGRYQDAFKHYESLQTLYASATFQDETFAKKVIALTDVNQAIILALLGQLAQARPLLQQAKDSFTALGETDLRIWSETELAHLDYTQGYYGSALRHYYQVRERAILPHLDDPHMLARTLLRMAACLAKLARGEQADQLAAQAMEQYRLSNDGLDRERVLDEFYEYTTALLASGRGEGSLTILREAEAIFLQKSSDSQVYRTKLQHAHLHLHKGMSDEAYDQARSSKGYFEAQGMLLHTAHASLVMAEALIERVQQRRTSYIEGRDLSSFEEAVCLCKQVSSMARQHELPEHAYKSEYLLGKLAALQGDLEQAAEHYDLAIGQIERMLDDLVYDLSSSFLHTVWVIYEERIALCLQQSQGEQAFNYLERVRSLALRQFLHTSRTLQDERRTQRTLMRSSLSLAHSPEVAQMMGELMAWKEKYHASCSQLATIRLSTSSCVDRRVLQKELKRCEEKLSELVERLHLQETDKRLPVHVKEPEKRNLHPIGITQLRQDLGPGQILLAYLLFRGRLVIFAVTTARLITHEVADGAAQVEHLVTLLHAHLQPQGWPNPQRPPQQPIRHLLHKLYHLLVAPVREWIPPSSRLLTIVPYGPLHTLPFHALYDGSHFLIEHFQINYLPASSILTYLSVLPGKQGEHSTQSPLIFGYSDKGDLPRALDEAKTIAAALSGRCYLEQEATMARLIEQAPGSPIIHLAAHGQSRLDAPNFSYMRLADGQLNALDIFNLNLEGCELVTLSGCETGLALDGGGDEQIGLGRAFLAAGARSLVMSLWSVEDTATNELMQLFYQRLLSGDSKGEALRAAQCLLLHRTTPPSSHPYFWAAFRLVGDAGPSLLKLPLPN